MNRLIPGKSASNFSPLALFVAAGFLTFGSPCLQAQSPPGGNLQLWLEANVGVTTNANGGVIEWLDQSTNRFSAAPPASSNAPVYLPNDPALDNKPSIQFNPGQWLQLGSTLDITGDMSAFVVLNLYSYPDVYRGIIDQAGANAYPHPNQWMISAVDGVALLQRGDGATTPGVDYNSMTSTGSVVTGQYVVLGFTSSNTFTTQYLNNNFFGSKTMTTSIAGSGIPMLIGARYQSESYLNGEIAELLIYNSGLSTSEVTAIWNYLNAKYNLQYSLAVSISSPANGATIAAPATVPVEAVLTTVTNANPSVTFYVNGVEIGTAISPPYTVPIQFNYPGSVTLTATVTDNNLGITASSAPVSVTITGSPPAYTPGTNLQLWLEANAGVTTNGSGEVTAWADQSGNNNNAALGAGGSPAPLLANALNGQPSVHLVGFNYNYYTVPNSPGLEITGDIATAMVVQDNSTSDARFPWWMGGASGYPSPNGFILGGTSPSLIRGTGYGDTQEYLGDPSPSYGSSAPIGVQSGQYYVILATQTGTAMTQFLNGTADGTGDFTLTPVDGEGGSPVYIGTRGDYYKITQSDLAIAELMIFNTGLTGTNLTYVQNYLLNKYGFAAGTASEAPIEPPTAAITSPANGGTVAWPTNLTVTVAAAAPTGAVSSVQLYMNGSLLATAIAPPYQFTVSFEGAGAATLTAVVTDNLGISTSSAPVSLTISGSIPTYASGTNLQLWLEANAGVITNGGGGVTGWNDQSGNNHNAFLTNVIVTNGNSYPGTITYTGTPSVLVENAVNGQPAIHLLGANNNFFAVANSAGLEITSNIASAMVVQDNSITDARFPWWMGGWSGLPSPNGFLLGGSSPCPIRGTGSEGGQELIYGNTGVQSGQYYVILFSQTGTTMTQYLDGVPNGSTAAFMLTPYDGEGKSPLYIGTRGDMWHVNTPGLATSDLAIAELMIFNTALSGTNLSNVQNYLLSKYGFVPASAVQTPVPSLSVVRQSNGSVLISWPQSYNGYILQSISNLYSGSWATVAGVVNNQISVTPAGGEQFYRLILP
jgi:hypothetical protein